MSNPDFPDIIQSLCENGFTVELWKTYIQHWPHVGPLSWLYSFVLFLWNVNKLLLGLTYGNNYRWKTCSIGSLVSKNYCILCKHQEITTSSIIFQSGYSFFLSYCAKKQVNDKALSETVWLVLWLDCRLSGAQWFPTGPRSYTVKREAAGSDLTFPWWLLLKKSTHFIILSKSPSDIHSTSCGHVS